MPDSTSKTKSSVDTRGHQRAPLDPREEKTPLHAEFDEAPPLTRDSLAAYNQSHNRLLVGLTLILAFVLSCFAISDPDIFLSLRSGQLIANGQFPWNEDPFGYAAGEHAPWVHPGWLGDLVIYELYQWGGGPLLVITRAVMMVLLFYFLFQLGGTKPRRTVTVLVSALGVLTLSQRFYFRTELFSYFLLGLTFWCLAARPGSRWLAPLNRLTAGRPYWLLPLIIVVWVNLDAWFFLGVATVAVWAIVNLVNRVDGITPKEARVLGLMAALCVGASLCSPYHLQVWQNLRMHLFPPTGQELLSRYEEQLQQNPSTAGRVREQERFFMSPWAAPYLNPQRSEIINIALAPQAPLLPLVYPKGVSLSEWAYYPLVALSLLSLLARGALRHGERLVLLLLFLALSCLQSRFVGFFAVAGTALAILNFQAAPVVIPSLNRFRILLGQLGRIVLGLSIQVVTVLMLIPTPDMSPAPYGHVHGRGHFGFAFRVDPGMRGVAEQLVQLRQRGRLAGRAFHLDWVDQPAYDTWFDPGSRHFFDRRHEVHSADTARAFFLAQDALTRITPERINSERTTPEKLKERRQYWQHLFAQHDISHLVLRRRGDIRRGTDVLASLLSERDEQNQPLWKPLRYHDGSLFVLAWTGSPHWPALQGLEFDPGESAFRTPRPVTGTVTDRPEGWSLASYLWGDAPRRPPGIDESTWYPTLLQTDPVIQMAGLLPRMELSGGILLNMGCQLAVPAFRPPLPLVLGVRQYSASTLLLSLQSARDAVAELSPEATPSQRAEAWQQYLQAAVSLSTYEASIVPGAEAWRDPQRLFLLRQATLANDAARRSDPLQHLQLARLYRQRRAFDAAFEHFQNARVIFERRAAETENPQRLLDQIPALVKQQAGFEPAELEAEWKRQLAAWETQVSQAGIPLTGGATKDALARAGLALQLGLPNKAFEEASRAAPAPEAYYIACQVCMALGQYDVQLRDYLLRYPQLRDYMEPGEFQARVSLGWWCLGRPDLAADARHAVGEEADLQARRAMLDSGAMLLFGTSSQRWGSAFVAVDRGQKTAALSQSVAEHRLAEGLLRLEAGQPARAAEVFSLVVHEIDPDTPWKPLLARYYHQITGKTIDEKPDKLSTSRTP